MKAFIFARGGSKGIKDKNISFIYQSKTLLEHTIENLNKVDFISEVYVSTDSKKIINVAKNYNVVIIERPDELASDTSNEINSWRHIVNNLSMDKDEPFFVTPVTSPFRNEKDFFNAKNLWETNNFEIILTRKKSSKNPFLNMITENQKGKLMPLKSKENIFRRQDAPLFYDILGLLYLTTPNYIENTKSLVDGKVGWVDIPENRSMDIDNPWDLELARLIYQNKLYEKKI